MRRSRNPYSQEGAEQASSGLLATMQEMADAVLTAHEGVPGAAYQLPTLLDEALIESDVPRDYAQVWGTEVTPSVRAVDRLHKDLDCIRRLDLDPYLQGYMEAWQQHQGGSSPLRLTRRCYREVMPEIALYAIHAAPLVWTWGEDGAQEAGRIFYQVRADETAEYSILSWKVVDELVHVALIFGWPLDMYVSRDGRSIDCGKAADEQAERNKLIKKLMR